MHKKIAIIIHYWPIIDGQNKHAFKTTEAAPYTPNVFVYICTFHG